jgi:hypothetical protein
LRCNSPETFGGSAEPSGVCIICLSTPSPFLAVGAHYAEFGQLADADVISLLEASTVLSAEFPTVDYLYCVSLSSAYPAADPRLNAAAQGQRPGIRIREIRNVETQLRTREVQCKLAVSVSRRGTEGLQTRLEGYRDSNPRYPLRVSSFVGTLCTRSDPRRACVRSSTQEPVASTFPLFPDEKLPFVGLRRRFRRGAASSLCSTLLGRKP